MKPQKGSRSTTLPFFKLGVRWRWVFNATPRPLHPRERDRVPISPDAGWAPGPVWTGAEKLTCTGIRSTDHPARLGGET
jgi:hypothetical protein